MAHATANQKENTKATGCIACSNPLETILGPEDFQEISMGCSYYSEELEDASSANDETPPIEQHCCVTIPSEVMFTEKNIHYEENVCHRYSKLLEIENRFKKVPITLKLYNCHSKVLEKVCCEILLSNHEAIVHYNTKILEEISGNEGKETENKFNHHYSKVFPKIPGAKKISSASMVNCDITKELEVSTSTNDEEEKVE